MAKESIHLTITGFVQGVFFRASASQVANKLGLRGWVRNSSGGNVELVAEGDRKQLENLIEWCRKGPPSAKVSDVKIIWKEPTGTFRSFSIY